MYLTNQVMIFFNKAGDTILIEEFYVVDSDNISVSEVQQDYIIGMSGLKSW